MISKKWCLGLILIAALAFSAHAETSASGDVLTKLTSQIKTTKLSNGLKVIMYKRGTAPVFAGAVVVRVGGVDEELGSTGISHLFEHIAFKGTDKIGTRDFSRENRLLTRLEEIAAKTEAANVFTPELKKEWDDIHTELRTLWINDDFSERYSQEGAAGLNATTDKELTKYFVSLPKSSFEFWCRMESLRLKYPVLRQFYQERDVVIEERRMRYEVDPLGKLYELLLGIAYVRHPYHNPVIGYEQDIRSLTATKLDDFRKRYYVPSNMAVGLVGDIDAISDLETVKKYFGDIPAVDAPEAPQIIEPKQEGERQIVVKAKAQPKVIIAYKKPASVDPRDPAISLMNEILAGSEVSPLYVELVKKRQIVSEIAADEEPGSMYPNLFMFLAEIKSPHDTTQFSNAFDLVIKNFKKYGPTEAQLERAKRSIGVSYLDRMKSNQSLATELASAELLYGNWKIYFDWYEKVMNVTVAEVKEAAAAFLNEDTRIVATIETE